MASPRSNDPTHRHNAYSVSSESRVTRPLPQELNFTLVFVNDAPLDSHEAYHSEESFQYAARNIRFNVATVGVPYFLVLDKFNDAIRGGSQNARFRVEDVVGFKELGLACYVNQEGLPTISGTPTREFKGKIRVRVCSERLGRPENNDVEIPREFLVSGGGGDPWALWQEIPAPANAPYQTSNADVVSGKIATSPPLVVIGASRRGRSHAHRGDFRDDAFAIKLADASTRLSENGKDDWHVFAVSDGAGSCVYSREGARVACNVLTKSLFDELNYSSSRKTQDAAIQTLFTAKYQQAFSQRVPNPTNDACGSVSSLELEGVQLVYPMLRAVHKAATAIQNVAEERKALEKRPVTMRHYSATALCVAMKRFEVDLNFSHNHITPPSFWAFLSYWIGDGAIAIYRPNGQDKVEILGEPDVGEYAGETRFITSTNEATYDRVAPRVRLAFVEDFEGLLLATDGVSDPFFTSDADLADFDSWRSFWEKKFKVDAPNAFNDRLTETERANALLEWLNFREKGYHDDRTAVVVLNDRNTGVF